MSGHRSWQMFFKGRHPVGLVSWMLTAVVGSFCLWQFPVAVRFFGESRTHHVSSVELVVLASIAGATWCLAPRMATWDAQGGQRVCRSAAAACLVVLIMGWCIAVLFTQFGYHLPFSLASREDLLAADFPLDRLSLAAITVATRVLIVGSLIMGAVALLGRVPGTIASVLSYYSLLYLGRSSTVLGTSGAGRGEVVAGVAFSVLLALAAAAIWWATAGAGVIARRLDSRS